MENSSLIIHKKIK